ncbi:hypothetical protein Gain_0191_012 [Komagataeibacter intermedius TF2]|nr:hypothetical protein Gain_0191_012 [Komagataeibacter intermedius TF2]
MAYGDHDHECLFATVTSVPPAQAQSVERADEYGTAATTVRAFHTAQGDGQGDDASAMVLPEKRSRPAFSPAGLTGFYGQLPDIALAECVAGCDQE